MTNPLEMTDDQLAIAVAIAFTPKPWKHGVEIYSEDGWSTKCPKCGGQLTIASPHATPKDGKDKNKPCPHPDPLDVTDWNVAMRLFRKASHDLPCKTVNALKTVFLHDIDDDLETADVIGTLSGREKEANANAYFVHYATPQDYIKAALKAKGNKDE